ncbi:MAG: hypothetical protein JSS99_04150 [Actinobacteria bacterium]|nr:hypothetical protein [Actinomycetota bacterium]
MWARGAGHAFPAAPLTRFSPMQEAPEIDLDAHRDAGDLIATTLVLFARHAALFLSVTLVIVAPVMVLVTGVWGGRLAGGSAADMPVAAAAVTAALAFVMPVLVTALHVTIVRDLGAGRVPTVAEAPRFPLALAAVVVYTILVLGGAILLIVPGIWVFIAGYFATQTAVMERCGPLAAFRRSSHLVEGRWWRTAGTLLLGWVLLTIASYLPGRAIDAIPSGVLYIALYILLQVLTLSLTALFGTLLYFSLQARNEHPFGAAPVGAYLPPVPPTPTVRSRRDP